MRFAVDASVLLAYVLPEIHSAAARQFFRGLRREDTLLAPALLLSECTSKLHEKASSGAISAQEGAAKLEQLLRLDIALVTDLDQHRLAMEIAAKLGTRRAYDAHYIAVARMEKAELVTIDGGMRQGAVNLNIPARLLR